MSYTYKTQGRGLDLIVPTKKGIENGMPKGAIIPIGYKHIPEVLDYVKNTKHRIYVAKHCDKENVLTHIQPQGIVNRFGWYISSSDILSVKPHWTLDVGGPAWFKKVTVEDIRDIEKYL